MVHLSAGCRPRTQRDGASLCTRIPRRSRAYLAHPILGPRLRECTQVVCNIQGSSIEQILGRPDDIKFRSSMTLFEAVSGNPVFRNALDKFCVGGSDAATLAILKKLPGPKDMTDEALITRLAIKHRVSADAVRTVLRALRSGGGRMAQFSHADFGGMSQWSPGMTMVGDMFNNELKAKLGAICDEIASHLANAQSDPGNDDGRDGEVSYRSTSRSDQWWPAGLGAPSSVGAQNALRYAVFPDTKRLAIQDDGQQIALYDTGDHRIFGVAQAQSRDQTLTLTSQTGLVRIDELQKVDS